MRTCLASNLLAGRRRHHKNPLFAAVQNFKYEMPPDLTHTPLPPPESEEMTLDPDAKAAADMLKTMMPSGLSGLGLEALRAFQTQMGSMNPPPEPIHHVADRVIPGPAGNIPIRVYKPQDSDDLPVLVYLHGGGWVVGSLDSADAICRALANEADCAVVSVDYRLAPEHKFPAPVDDAYAAVEWVAENGSALGVDSTRLAIGGDSAGSNLSAAVTLLARDRSGPRICFQLLAYPATEYAVERASWIDNAHAPMLTSADTLWFWNQYLRDESDRTDPRATPSNATSFAGLPPAFVFTAEYDPLRDDGEQYAQRLVAAGVHVSAKRYPGVFHGFFNMVGALTRTSEAVTDSAGHLKAAFSA